MMNKSSLPTRMVLYLLYPCIFISAFHLPSYYYSRNGVSAPTEDAGRRFLHLHCRITPPHSARNTLRVRASPDDGSGSGDKQKRGYRFGDLTRGLARSAASNINSLTGKEKYKFGDLSRWADAKAKERVSELTGKENYEFGDLTRWVDSAAKEKVANFTGKADDYSFGDISREILRRVQAGEVELQDVFLALRILLTAGANLSPIASALPISWLFKLLNFGLAQDVTGRLLQVLAKSLDERTKEALTGDSQYKLGDLTKGKIQEAISNFTGKKEYEFGDISRTVIDLARDNKSDTKKSLKQKQELQLEDDIATKELDDWDDRFQKETHSRGSLDSLK